MSPAENDLLRQMVRQVLAEIVPQAMASAEQVPAAQTVPVASDADLQAFARRVAEASEAERAAIVSGATVFRLAVVPGAAPAPAGSPAGTPGAPVVRIDSGPVTERHVRSASDAGATIVLGRKAVLTPLARDRARAAGVEITRER